VDSGTLELTPNVVQDFGASGSSSVTTSYTSDAFTVTTTWQEFSVTLDVPSIVGKTISGGDDHLQVGWSLPLSAGTYTLSFTNAKCERGSIATPFVRPNPADELTRCQRYYQASSTGAGAAPLFIGDVTSGGAYYDSITLPVEMRATPSLVVSSIAISRFGTPSAYAASKTHLRASGTATGTGRGYFVYSYTADAEL